MTVKQNNLKEIKMSDEKGLKKPVKLKKELAALVGASEMSRMDVTSKLWEHIKGNKLQTSKAGGKPENKGKFIVVDKALLPVVKNTKVTTKAGKKVDLSGLKEGDTVDMMQIASIVSANIE